MITFFEHDTAKEGWDYLEDLYEGNSSVQRSKFVIIQQQIIDFVILDGEKPAELFRRLKSLSLEMKSHGCKDNNDEWFKTKFLQTIISYDKHLVMMTNQIPDYLTMYPSDVLASFMT